MILNLEGLKLQIKWLLFLF